MRKCVTKNTPDLNNWSSDLCSKVGLMGQQDNGPMTEIIQADGKMTQQYFHAMVKHTMCPDNGFKFSKTPEEPGTIGSCGKKAIC